MITYYVSISHGMYQLVEQAVVEQAVVEQVVMIQFQMTLKWYVVI